MNKLSCLDKYMLVFFVIVICIMLFFNQYGNMKEGFTIPPPKKPGCKLPQGKEQLMPFPLEMNTKSEDFEEVNVKYYMEQYKFYRIGENDLGFAGYNMPGVNDMSRKNDVGKIPLDKTTKYPFPANYTL